jgi:uncharacterized membrane protein YraQ (UPF0718 family)
MDTLLFSILPVLHGGLGNLAAYLAAHVLLCLLPAFFIAGAMAALIPKETVTRFLGRNSSKVVSYPAAAAAGSLLAVCSCTIVPLFAGIHKKGAGLGPAITFLFFAPAANILALVYTGGVIGPIWRSRASCCRWFSGSASASSWPCSSGPTTQPTTRPPTAPSAPLAPRAWGGPRGSFCWCGSPCCWRAP